jgi:hypothetical protein
MSPVKRQLSFYAESDVDLYLSLLETGRKTAVLNDSIRSRMAGEAMVDLNNGQSPVNFGLLQEIEQSEIASNLMSQDLSLQDLDIPIWEVVTETASRRNWKDNTQRYLALHQAKFNEPFRIKRMRSLEEREEYRRKTQPRTKYYCNTHVTNTAQELNGFYFGELKCAICKDDATFRDSK